MTPQTSREWAKLIARSGAHPDVGGDVEAFLALRDQRERWEATHYVCTRAQCGRTYVPRIPQQRFCSQACVKAAVSERTRRRLTGERQPKAPVGLSREAVARRHAGHAATFGPFAACQHTSCVKARGKRYQHATCAAPRAA